MAERTQLLKINENKWYKFKTPQVIENDNYKLLGIFILKHKEIQHNKPDIVVIIVIIVVIIIVIF